MAKSSATNPAIIPVIAALPLFQNMEKDLLGGLISSSRLVTLPKGEVFVEQGQPISRFYIVLDGWCGASRTNSDGQESILQIFRRGDSVPDINQSEANKISAYNMQALTEVHLLMISPSLLQNAARLSPTFNANIQNETVRRANELRDHVEQLTLHTAEERVGRFLLQIRNLDPNCTTQLDIPFDKSIVASYLGIKPETFSRCLKQFKEQGIAVDGLHLRLPDRLALCDYCDQIAAQSCRHASSADCPQHETEMPQPLSQPD